MRLVFWEIGSKMVCFAQFTDASPKDVAPVAAGDRLPVRPAKVASRECQACFSRKFPIKTLNSLLNRISGTLLGDQLHVSCQQVPC
jgi:hypothetical protein